MSVELATAYVQLVPSAQGMQSAIAAQMGGPATAAGAGAGTSFAAGFSRSTKVLAGGALFVGAAAQLGSQFDDAFDTIRVGTAATGAALQGLEGDFKAVAQAVPTNFADAGTAVADLNTRLGLTGPELQGVSSQLLELSRITGTDVGGNIESVTRFLGDAGVATEDYSSAIDALFRASQATGPSVARLGDLAVQYGAPLRNFGFSFEESAALLGKFEQEGVNTELVMGSLRIALGKFARAGEDPVEALEANVDAIKNAGSAAEANSLAFEIFGARAGADMAAAIREGRFEIGDLLDTVRNGEETVLGAADDTKDLAEQWQLLRNKVFVGLQPQATKLFTSLGRGVEALIPVVDLMLPAFTGLIDVISQVPAPVLAGAAGLLAFAAVGVKIVKFGKTVVTAISGVGKAFSLLAANPWVLVIIAAVALAFVIVRYWDEITAAVSAAWSWVAQQAATIWNGIKDFFTQWWPLLLVVFTGGIGLIVVLIAQNWDAIWAKTQEVWNLVSGFVGARIEDVKGFISGLVAKGQELIDWFAGLPGRASSAWEALKSTTAEAVGFLKRQLDELLAAVDRALGPLDEVIGKARSFAGGAIGGIGGLLGFDSGGVIPGRRGQPRLVVAHGGETMVPTHRAPMLDALRSIGAFEPVGNYGGARAIDNSIHFHNPVVRDEADIKAIVRQVNGLKRSQGGRGDGGLNW